MTTFTLTIPEAPRSLNAGGAGSRRHWGAAYREKKKWAEAYAAALLGEGVPRGMVHCRVDAVIRWRRHLRRDVTNYEPAIVKPLADVLVNGVVTKKDGVLIPGGWLPDDTAEFFTFGELTFEHPKPWPHPLLEAEMELNLHATYESSIPSDTQSVESPVRNANKSNKRLLLPLPVTRQTQTSVHKPPSTSQPASRWSFCTAFSLFVFGPGSDRFHINAATGVSTSESGVS